MTWYLNKHKDCGFLQLVGSRLWTRTFIWTKLCMMINFAGEWIHQRTRYNILNNTMRAADSTQITMTVVYWLLRSELSVWIYIWKYNNRYAMKIAAMKLIRDATREINARRLLFINRFGETRMFIVMTLLLLVQEKRRHDNGEHTKCSQEHCNKPDWH